MKFTLPGKIKKNAVIFLSLICFSIPVIAAEAYVGNLTTTNYKGRYRVTSFTIKYEVKPDHTISGEFTSTKVGRSQKQCPITGAINNNKLTFKAGATEEGSGCGQIAFNGTRKGDSWVGTLTTGGDSEEITFNKQ